MTHRPDGRTAPKERSLQELAEGAEVATQQLDIMGAAGRKRSSGAVDMGAEHAVTVLGVSLCIVYT